MRQQGGNGAVVRKGLVLTRTGCPRLTAVRHANNRDFWVVVRDLDTRGFQSFRLGAAAAPIGPAVVSLAGQARFPDLAELKAAPDGRRLVCGSLTREAEGPRAGVCVYDFDPGTGRVQNELVVRSVAVPPFPTTATGQPRDGSPLSSASFSPDSRLLYTCELPGPAPAANARRQSDIWQYDLGLAGPAAIAQSRRLVSDVPLPPSPADFMACRGLQLAPDGTLWSANCYQRRVFDPITNQPNQWAAAIIRHPNVYGLGCGFEVEGYPYQPGQFPSSSLPNLITNMLYAPAALNYEAACPDDSVQFWASSAGNPAGLRWDFGEPASGAANAAIGPFAAHRYARGGTYPVRLILADGRVLTQPVTVSGAAADFTGENVFTPNADGQNDQFVPVRQPLPGGRLRVFSRWGQLVFQTTDPALRWDGAGAAPGDYFYLLEYPDCQGQPRQRRGPVALVR
jgi:gliding motility-associated-like protein